MLASLEEYKQKEANKKKKKQWAMSLADAKEVGVNAAVMAV